jgi:serine/threonine protein kinase
MRELTNAIKYIHSKGIVHRDLKLDNIIICEDKNSTGCSKITVKLIDFGLSKLTTNLKEGQTPDLSHSVKMNTFCGTVDFMSPEVLEGKPYDKSTDMWSLGVIAYFLLSGKPPFYAPTEPQVISKIVTCNYSFSAPVWISISPTAKSWIDNIFEKEPRSRANADACANHPWLLHTHGSCIKSSLNIGVLSNLHDIKKPSELLFQMLVLFCQYLNDQDIKNIKMVFQHIDKD